MQKGGLAAQEKKITIIAPPSQECSGLSVSHTDRPTHPFIPPMSAKENLWWRQPFGCKVMHTMCASSWAITVVTLSLFPVDDLRGSKSSAVSLYVIKPQFSIAPAWKSGRAIWSGTGWALNDHRKESKGYMFLIWGKFLGEKKTIFKIHTAFIGKNFFFQTLSNQQRCIVGKLSHSPWKMCPESLLTFVVEALFFQPKANIVSSQHMTKNSRGFKKN